MSFKRDCFCLLNTTPPAALYFILSIVFKLNLQLFLYQCHYAEPAIVLGIVPRVHYLIVILSLYYTLLLSHHYNLINLLSCDYTSRQTFIDCAEQII